MRTRTKTEKAEKKPRGRPRAYEPETALRQAMDLFWKVGYSGASLDQIAAATGMNRPSLRAAFGDKHAIYMKALGGYWQQKFTSMREALESDLPLKEALMSVYDAALSVYFSGEGRPRGCFVVGTAVTESVDDPEIRKSVNNGFHALDAKFEARLQTARDDGELPNDADPGSLALMATATMHTIAMRARAGTSRADLRKFARKAIDVICS